MEVKENVMAIDSMIRIVYEEQTLNNHTIQLIMQNMNLFGEQMKFLHQNIKVTPTQEPETPITATMITVIDTPPNEYKAVSGGKTQKFTNELDTDT